MKFAALKFQQSVVAIVAEQSGQKSASFNYFFLFPKLWSYRQNIWFWKCDKSSVISEMFKELKPQKNFQAL